VSLWTRRLVAAAAAAAGAQSLGLFEESGRGHAAEEAVLEERHAALSKRPCSHFYDWHCCPPSAASCCCYARRTGCASCYLCLIVTKHTLYGSARTLNSLCTALALYGHGQAVIHVHESRLKARCMQKRTRWIPHITKHVAPTHHEAMRLTELLTGSPFARAASCRPAFHFNMNWFELWATLLCSSSASVELYVCLVDSRHEATPLATSAGGHVMDVAT
jgi:hypothetical protein